MRVVRLCSVYEVPPEALSRRAVRFDAIGGMQSHVGSLTRVLDRLGVEQHVVTTKPPGSPATSRVGVRSLVHRVGLPVPWLRQGYGACAAVLLPRLPRRVDVVHAHLGEDVAVLPLAVAAARRAAAGLVVTLHTSVRHTLAVTDARAALIKALGGPIEVAACRRADAVLTLTGRMRELVVRSGVDPSRVHVVPSGVELGMFVAGGDDPLAAVPRPRVVFVGRLCAQKDPLTLVRAVPLLRTDASVVVVGDGPLRAEVEDEVRRLGVGDRVHLVGAVPRSRVPSYLAGGDVFVLPSRYEELGTAIVEASAAGLPLVASRTGGIPDVVDDGVDGLLVDPGSPAAVAAAVDRVLADADLARRLGGAARAKAGRYDWDSLGRAVHTVYEAVGRARRPTSRP